MASQLTNLTEIFGPNFRFQVGILPLSDWSSVIGGVSLYLFTIFGLKKWMEDKKKFDLKWVVIVHNFFLSALSLTMMIGMLYEILNKFITSNYDVKCLLCDPNQQLTTGKQIGWFYIFFLSKYYEFLDTIIICLKKRPIIFLHVYHHCITLVLVFVMLSNEVAVQWIAMTANCLVHVPMYYYYAMSSLGYEIWWKKYITMLQIIQFVIDITANSIGFVYHLTGSNCSGSLSSWVFGQSILLSFLVLFIAFFKENYKKKPTSTATTNGEVQSNGKKHH
jgi:fatty acid elongase 3